MADKVLRKFHTPSGKPELLIPAGGLDTLKVAVAYGADAVYIGGKNYGLRAKADNFTIEEMGEAADYCHARGVKLYVTVNIFAHNADIEGIRKYFEELAAAGLEEKIDGFIISDPGVFELAAEILPGIDRHVSTQANNTNYLTFRYWNRLGATRVVAARELSLRELSEIRSKIPEEMEIEAFIHGAMCISYSGRCLLSSYFTGRDANRGACTHPCRWKYSLVESERPGEYLPVEEDDRGTYIMNSKDLCMVGHIPELVEAGIDSFKIEGRMKTALYTAVVTRTYRQAIDDYYTSEKLYRRRLDYYMDEISACTYRSFTTGFYFGRPDESSQVYENNTYVEGAVFIGTIEKIDAQGRVHFPQKNKFLVGEIISAMGFNGSNYEMKVESIQDEEGTEMESAPHPKQPLSVKLVPVEPGTDIPLAEGMILRRMVR